MHAAWCKDTGGESKENTHTGLFLSVKLRNQEEVGGVKLPYHPQRSTPDVLGALEKWVHIFS